MPAFDPPLTGEELEAAMTGCEVRDVLPAGGQGAVFRCLLPDGEAAIKVYGPGANLSRRVEREIAAMKLVDCANLAQLITHGQIRLRGADHLFASVEYIEGPDLQRMPRQAWNEKLAKQLLRDCATAIAALWEERIVHRDIKPSNIVRSKQDGRFVVIDLGLVKRLGEETVTETGAVCGTRGYMSPEQASARPRALTFRSDMYALGMVTYEMLAGGHPFQRTQELMRKVPPALHSFTPTNKQTSELIDRMLQIDAVRRPTCEEVLEICKE